MSFRETVYQRCIFAREIYLWGWRWVVFVVWAIPYGIAGLYDLLQGQYFPSWPNIGNIAPVWVYLVWLGVGILVFIIITLEGAYRLYKQKMNQQETTQSEVITCEPKLFILHDDEFPPSITNKQLEVGLLFHPNSYMIIESIELEIQDRRIPAENFKSLDLALGAPTFGTFKFELPKWVTLGTHSIRYLAFSNKKWWASEYENIVVT